jgi:phenylalanyl-tRNA synthetase beta chain
MTLPMLSPADLQRAGITRDTYVEVENPLRAEESVLRPSIMPGLLKALQYNASHGNTDVALFEIGTVFFPPDPDRPAKRPEFDGVYKGDSARLPDEHEHLAAVRAGVARRRPFDANRPVEPADLVAVVDALASALRLADVRLVAAAPEGYHPTRAANVTVDGAIVGAVGEVAPDVVRAHGLDTPVVGFELDVDLLLAGDRRDPQAQAVSRFPAHNIDLAFVVAERVPAAAVEATLRSAGGDLLEAVHLFDVFRSPALGEGRRSLAFALRFRAPDRTLTDDEVAQLRQACIDAVVREHGAELRS